jgi:tetratricopeptide (TPR) repeat protein
MKRLLALVIFFTALAAQAAATTLVAPFSNRTKDSNLDWIGESISESVRETLAAEGVGAVPREDRLQAARKLSLRPSSPMTLASAIKLAEAAESPMIVYGQFELIPGDATQPGRGSLRITARIFDRIAVVGRQEFAEAGALEDLAILQMQIAWQALQALRPGRHLSRERFLEQRKPVKLPALENYIRGLMSTKSEIQHRFFTQAARIDPDYPQPCYYLGKMHFAKDNYREAAMWLEKVIHAAPYQLEARFLLGLSRYEIGEFEGARQAFQQFADVRETPEVRNNLGAVLLRLERFEALDYFRKALEADAKDPDYHFNVGYALWKRGEFDAAADRFRAVLDREHDDHDAILLLGRCLKKSGPRPGDTRGEGLERLKDSWTEGDSR